MKKNNALLLTMLLGILGGCSSNNNTSAATQDNSSTDNDSFTISYTSVDCTTIVDKELVDAGVFGSDGNTECGKVRVPADWDDPSGSTLDIMVYKIPSTSTAPASDPVVYLEGGPGGGGIGMVREFSNGRASYLRNRSDVIVIDQRGTGYSTPSLYCRETVGIDIDPNNDPDGIIPAAIQTCHDRLLGEGVVFSNYTSKNSALDVEAIREALDYDLWNLYGGSYGTRLALTVMREKPNNLRSVLLDSVFPIEVNGLSESTHTAYWAIEQILTNCAADNDCSAEIGDLKQLIESGIARLDANPFEFLTADIYLRGLIFETTNSKLPSLANAVANGSEDEIISALESFYSEAFSIEPLDALDEVLSLDPIAYQPVDGDAEAMYFSVVCAEEAPFKEITASPDLSGNFTETTQRVINQTMSSDSTYEICDAVFNVPAANIIETKAVESNIPTLVLSGTADALTPPTWSLLVHESLGNSQYAEFTGLNHVVLGRNSCVDSITLGFLDDPTSSVDQGCILELDGVDYIFD